MKVPNANRAVIAPEKLRDYLLNLGHRGGGSKAKLLHLFGYRTDDWHHLERDIREQHLTVDIARTVQKRLWCPLRDRGSDQDAEWPASIAA